MRDLRILSRHLPFRTCARLRLEWWINAVGGWLAGHRHSGAAERLWRACRMW
ncbi:hypothetical protein N8I84_42110 (plasmid) [Streptomyces cynarae]|uniref:Uncharacterized protein n=1 Tax=Streptomyces cynarae TaxID=2981134 RepID=A0ABY6EE43_9ACTN|nr:hypothetical protein [Streptomyces cynarae]UXY25024.1 hypothetical protein N8I84_42110 [Streptomyces cynarae]